LLSPQLLNNAILGLDFLVDYHSVINFAERSITLRINSEYTKIAFIDIKETTNKLGDIGQSSSEDQFHGFGLVSGVPRKLLSLTADPGQCSTDPIVTVDEDASVKNEKGRASLSERNKEQLIEDEVDVLIPRQVGDRDEYVEFASRYDDACWNLHEDLSTLAKDKEAHAVDDCSAIEHKTNEEGSKTVNVAANNRTLCSAMTSSKPDAVNTQHIQQGRDTRQIVTDVRMITTEQLHGKVHENNNLSPQQQEDLYNVLV
jgi:hypothetical protein